ncbi:MAG: MBL fold metallo-hydrolase [Patescibacteria group bacterium]
MYARAALSVVLIAIAMATWSAVLAGRASSFLHVYALNVGQGDAIYIRTPNASDVLIDGGPGGRIISELPRVMPPGDKHIDAMILTHPHFDHVSGLERILEEYEVASIYTPTGMPAGELTDNFMRLARSETPDVRTLDAGDRLTFGDGVLFDVFLPSDAEFLRTTDNPNEWSIVGKLQYGNSALLLTGDMERREELLLMRSDAVLASDVLKVAHHGSAYASITGLLERIRPAIAVVSVGKNTYGHPSEDTLTRIARTGAEILRTDEQGTVHLVSDGTRFWVEGQQ